MQSIIIGGGLGGLFTGAFLAREGYAVKIFEKNRTAGGGLQTFRRHGAIFDTGMHTLGGFGRGATLDKICRYLGIRDRLTLRADDCLTEITYGSDGRTYRPAIGRYAFAESLAADFPAEREGISAYVDALYRLADEVPLFHLNESSDTIMAHSEEFLLSADALIARYVRDPRLRDLLAYMNPMYGGMAGHTPAYVHALINVFYIEGPCRFVGGSQQMADALVEVITAAGGEVRTGCAVTRIEAEERQVRAVVTADGHRHPCDTCTAALHPQALLPMLPDGALPRAYRNRLTEIPNTTSAFTVFATMREGAFPYIDHTAYYQADYGQIWQHADTALPGWPRGFMYFTPPVAEQGPWARTVIINCLMPFAEVERWADTRTGQRGADYEAWKAQTMHRVIERMEEARPGFIAATEQVFAASPLTIRDYYASPEGALFGYRKDCTNITLSYLPVVTKVHGLLLTGQCVNLHGICGVPLTAINTVEALTGRNSIIRKINHTTQE